MYNHKPLPFDKELEGISSKTIETHHGKLYKGYVDKSNSIKERLTDIAKSDNPEGNQTYSELRSLKNGESFANNGVYLHEKYFDILGGDGKSTGELAEAISAKYGSVEQFQKYFTACAMAARGWTILAWDANVGELRVFNCDAHNHGGIWGAIPIITCDVYEHSYFMDTGSDRKTYIDNFFKNLNWEAANELFRKAQELKI
ncbi:MAG: superoxide dismutase [Candidatus Yanofskybacteria bacterium CG10_big_fil_rev_8_21_14_0_10_36_16]|uniref:Superoxide dismutase n=1 Tax=Candidatus Yanofskybacteria bacterium CG10_big_fil_rev_8_21_14_0_10_36_16 TaxID=1975096 RepID=A0A2J0QBE6_9BACT|nr:MAG: superoxide dismutase [Candidatus Yanofskybacteria bacterium CG10_big_fil_rev_8_21_14_0_10_36_16]